MKYTVISAREFKIKLKCTVHSTGKIGFTEATAKHMKLSPSSLVQFATDDNDHDVMYLIHCKEATEDAFKVTKAGDYFYVNTKAMFDALDFDYKKNSYIFDMTEIKEENIEIYKLTKRIVPRKK